MAAVSIRNRVRKLEAESSSDLVVLSCVITRRRMNKPRLDGKLRIPARIWSGLGW